MKDIITIPVQITKIETKADRSIKITAVTATEVDPNESSVLFNLANKMGYMGFSEREIQGEDFDGLPDEVVPEFKGDKTPGQRLRGCFYRLWEQNGKQGEFELYYKRAMERLIDQVKDKLN